MQYAMRSGQTARKVPEIIALFWIIKLLSTAMGEATSDFLVADYNKYLAVLASGVMFVFALYLQFRTKKYVAWVYWFCVSMVAVFGTMAADVLHIQFHVPYVASTIFYAILLAIVFTTWQKSEKTLSIHSITRRRREVFYWLAVFFTFALGTALGDLTAVSFKLGYFGSGVMFFVLILLPLLAYKLGANEILCFWVAYILTRPLGASFADWTSKSRHVGALSYGDGHVAIVLVVIIFVLVAYLAITKRDIKDVSSH